VPSPSRVPRRPVSVGGAVSALASGALIASSLLGGVVPASAAARTASAEPAGHSVVDLTAGRYVVTLEGDSAATYEGSVRGLARTLPEPGDQLDIRLPGVGRYIGYLEQRQQQLAARAGVTIGASYTLALNGFSADLTADQAAALAVDPAVASLTPDTLLHPTATPAPDFLGLTGDAGVWAATGGVATAGSGIVLGVLDTGIAPENPSFAGLPLGGAAGDAPYYSAPGVVSYAKADGGTFTGACETGEQFDTTDCSTTVIGARYFVDGFRSTGAIASAPSGEYLSPRDGDGHGSHTASTAVGATGVAAVVGGRDSGSISGVAPAAKVAAYKVCWTGDGTTADGCALSDIVSGIDAAVGDGVDVLNYSIGGGAATGSVTPIDQAFLGAASAGVFVAASAGNDGPAASTLDNASPWITTVAASTLPGYEATVELGDGERLVGASVTVDGDPDAAPLTGRLLAASAVAGAGAADARLCLDGTLDALRTAGAVVICERGVNDRVAKSAEVARAGGIGMVLVNVEAGSTDVDDHAVPTVHLDARYRDRLLAYAEAPDATATLLPGNRTGAVTPVPQLAGFSSRGPAAAEDGDVLKPDIAAPGVGILAATANAEGQAPAWAFASGTSMAAPHIAGLAALYLGESPLASPAEIKSAMMTSAYDLVDADGAPLTDPFAEGAGHVDPPEYLTPGLVYLAGASDWASYIAGAGHPELVDPSTVAVDPSDLNLPSIAIGSLAGVQTVTRTVTATEAGTFTAEAHLPGVAVAVEPAQLTFAAAGESASYTVSFTADGAPLDEFSTGSLTWTSGTTSVRSPLAVRPVVTDAPHEVEGRGDAGSVEVPVVLGAPGPIGLDSTGLVAGERQADPAGGDPDHSGSGSTGETVFLDVTLAEGVRFARFALDSLDDTADLTLAVTALDAGGAATSVHTAETDSADERIDIESAASRYLVQVTFVDAPQSTAFDLTTFGLGGNGGGGAPLVPDPSALAGPVGGTVSYTASWSGLAPRTSYLGRIAYGGGDRSTLVSVTSDEPTGEVPIAIEPPSITGTPAVGRTLAASTGFWTQPDLAYGYQWHADGRPITGATDSTYVPTAGQEGMALTVVVTATTLDGLVGTATSDPVTARFASTTALRLGSPLILSSQRGRATITVAQGGGAAPVGVVRLQANGRTIGSVALRAADAGTVTYRLPALRRGAYLVEAVFDPAGDTTTSSTSASRLLWVLF
jgi:subtilisin family serine protease